MYIYVQSRALRDGPAVEQVYRAWVRDEPEHPVARISLAAAMHYGRADPGPWCDEIDGLIDPIPDDPTLAYWAHRTRLEIRRKCPGDTDRDREALIALGETLPEAWGYRLRLLVDGEITPALADELSRFWDDQPHRLGYVFNPWQERYYGDGLDEARAALLERARAQAQAAEAPNTLSGAIGILRWASADEDEITDAQDRLRAIDPGRSTTRRSGNGTVTWAPRSSLGDAASGIYDAAREDRPRAQLQALQALDEELPADGPLRALWWEFVARAESKRGDDAAAAEAWAAAWRADPTDPGRASQCGWSARDAGEGLDEALAVIDEALALAVEWDARGDHSSDNMTEWLQRTADERARLLEVRGELLRTQDRLEEARDVLLEAVLLADQRAPYIHIRLGRIYVALGEDEAALAHFGLGYASGGLEEMDDWWRAADREARRLYAAHRWSPTGFEGWVDSIAATLPSGDGEDAPSGWVARQAERSAWLQGQPFPDLALLPDGEPDPSAERGALSDIEGVKVVDLWATWCGPCIMSLPDLDKKAAAWRDRGVTFLAVSVDDAPQDVIDWLEENRRHRGAAYTRAWAGPAAMKEARVTGIPAVFVIDAEGNIYAFRSGSGYDDWLDEQLTALVGGE